VSTQDRERLPRDGGSMTTPPLRSLDERRVDPGTIRRENVDRPSLLAPVPPKTPDPVRAKAIRER
jgi:hypothetical protein